MWFMTHIVGILICHIWCDDSSNSTLIKYGSFNYELDQLLKANLPDVYLLCDWNIPWEYDPLRENPLDRDKIFQYYLRELEDLKVPYYHISGTIAQRIQQSSSIIKKLIS